MASNDDIFPGVILKVEIPLLWKPWRNPRELLFLYVGGVWCEWAVDMSLPIFVQDSWSFFPSVFQILPQTQMFCLPLFRSGKSWSQSRWWWRNRRRPRNCASKGSLAKRLASVLYFCYNCLNPFTILCSLKRISRYWIRWKQCCLLNIILIQMFLKWSFMM